jgi:hypothetical protein
MRLSRISKVEAREMHQEILEDTELVTNNDRHQMQTHSAECSISTPSSTTNNNNNNPTSLTPHKPSQISLLKLINRIMILNINNK